LEIGELAILCISLSMVNMNDQASQFPDYKWPRLPWRAMLSTFFGSAFLGGFTILGAAPVILDDAGDRWLQENSVTVVTSYLLFSLLLISLFGTIPLIRTAWHRCIEYSKLHSKAESMYRQLGQFTIQLTDAKKELSALSIRVLKATKFEITAEVVDKGELYILVRMRKSPKLSEGDTLRVRHIQDDMIIGYFQVTEVRSLDYVAKGVKNID
jgi:hypothetical protein